jgi:hypothetical protein
MQRPSQLLALGVQTMDQLQTGTAIELSRDTDAISGLEGLDPHLRLGGRKTIDRPQADREVAQVHFRQRDISLSQDPVESGVFNPRLSRWLARSWTGEEV